MLFLNEIKRFVGEGQYKRVLVSMIAAVITGLILYSAATELTDRGSLFEPFTLGAVVNRDEPEMRLLFDFFNEYVLDLQHMDMEEALTLLNEQQIPAFVEMPESFAADIMRGYNSPFTVHVGEGFPLQVAMVQLLAEGGIAFLSVSQAGIYATIDEALALGMTWEEVQSAIIIPVNVAFIQFLANYQDLFTREIVLITGEAGGRTGGFGGGGRTGTVRTGGTAQSGENIAAYFTNRFIVFWFIANLLVFINSMREYPPGISARLKLARIPAWKVMGSRFLCMWLINFVIGLPLLFFMGLPVVLALAAFAAAFGLLARTLFKQDSTCGLFIFFTALGMYFASGGIIPMAFMPQNLWWLQNISINHQAAQGNVIWIALAAVFCIGTVNLIEVLRRSTPFSS